MADYLGCHEEARASAWEAWSAGFSSADWDWAEDWLDVEFAQPCPEGGPSEIQNYSAGGTPAAPPRLLRGGGWGLLVQPGGEGLTAEITRSQVDGPILHALEAQEAPAIVDLSETLALSHADTKALQAELLAAYARYTERA